MKKIARIFMIFVLSAAMAACGTSHDSGEADPGVEKSEDAGETEKLSIAYQYGLAYAPLAIMKEEGLIEEAYKEATGKTVEIVWNQMSAGADINTGIAAGSIQVGFLGVAPAITGVVSNVGYKIFTNLSGQEHGLMTNDENIKTLGDLIGSGKQIALVNIGSIQHIILGIALDHAGYDAHALDSNLVAMKHPDGMTSLETGAVACHLTTNPYLYKERDEGLYEVEGISDVWSGRNSFIVGVASTELFEDRPELYTALCSAVEDAISYLNENPEDAAELTYEFDGNSPEEELEYLQAGFYATQTSGIFECAKFMADAKFIDEAPGSYDDLVFENVKGD